MASRGTVSPKLWGRSRSILVRRNSSYHRVTLDQEMFFSFLIVYLQAWGVVRGVRNGLVLTLYSPETSACILETACVQAHLQS